MQIFVCLTVIMGVFFLDYFSCWVSVWCYCWWCENVRVWVWSRWAARRTAHWGRDEANNSPPLDTFLPSLCSTSTHLFSFFIFINLFIHLCFGLCCAAVLVFCGFYRFLQPVLLYSQHNQFSLWVVRAKMLGKLGYLLDSWWFEFQ